MPALKCTKCGQPIVSGSRFCNRCGAPMPAGSPFAIEEDASIGAIHTGDVLEGKWKVEGKVGQGGMGSVYVATDLALERKVAIKALATELCKDEEFVTRFDREAKLTATLEHPNVVLVYGVGRHLGRPFIVMKFLQGETLARRINRLKAHKAVFEAGDALSVVRQVCAGLDYIHLKGLVHRDIKTGNIFLGPDGHATILDFGILRDLKKEDGLTRAGIVMGTPYYVSPEQATGKPLDARSDLYALGVVMYEMLTGEPPYNADNEFDLIEKHVRAPPPDPCLANPALPPAVGAVLQRCIAKRPADRYQTGAELAEALEHAFALDADPDGPATTPSLLASIEDTDRARPAVEEEEPPTEPSTQAMTAPTSVRSGSRLLWIGTIVGALLTVGVILLSYLANQPDPPPPEHPPVALPKPPVKKAPPPKPVPKPVPEPELAEDEEWVEEDEPDAGAAPSSEAAPTLLRDALRRDPAKAKAILTGPDAGS